MQEVLVHWFAAVSFARTPLEEVSQKVAEIVALGWEVRDRGDPWVVMFAKRIPESVRDSEAEIRAVLGEYWMTTDDIRELRESVRER